MVALAELERYRQLAQEYKHRTAEYEKLRRTYRDALEAGKKTDPEVQRVKEQIDSEFPQLQALFNQLKTMRTDLAEARDAAITQ